MKIHSESFEHGKPIRSEFAMGAPGGFGGNRNPHVAWNDVPAGTRSFALLCIDTDAPTDAGLVADGTTPIPVEHPRGEFMHWAVADIPAGTRQIPAGSCSEGVSQQGKGAGLDAGGRRGMNDYTGWFASTLVTTAPIRRRTTCACIGISSGCLRWMSKCSNCPSTSPLAMC
jgi:phosphatidylethanolamine-binding protein (PEBP) family uncharacterized protein